MAVSDQEPAAEERLAALGHTLPEPRTPVANYVMAVQSGRLLFVSGHISTLRGRVGAEVGVEQARAAAEQVTLDLLATVRAAVGSLDRVSQVVKLLAVVASAPGFTGQPAVVNGASDLLVAVFGDRGRHARSAIGVVELPMGASVEIEAIFEVEGEVRSGFESTVGAS